MAPLLGPADPTELAATTIENQRRQGVMSLA
jgi:hypothetical protein